MLETEQEIEQFEQRGCFQKPFRSVYMSPLWLVGFVTVILSMLVNGIALAYGSVVLLSSTSVLTIIMSNFMAPCFFGEKLQCKADGVSAVILTIGCILCVSQVPKEIHPGTKGIAKRSVDTMTTPRTVFFLLITVIMHCIFSNRKDELIKGL